MITMQKKVGTMAVQVTIANQSNGVHVSGEVHPFIDRFHCVRFDVRERKEGFDAQVGCGSSGMSLGESARISEALTVANDLASYYKDIGDTLLKKASHDQNYRFLLQRLFDNNDVEALADIFMMTPKNITQDNVETALALLDKHLILPGMEISVRDTLANDFFALPDITVEAISSLLEHHPGFEVVDKDFIGSAVNFLYNLKIKETA